MNAHTRPPSTFTATCITRDHLWLELTAAANHAFKEGAIDKAETLYRRGLAEAERLFAARDETAISVPLPVIINLACHNLAQLVTLQGNEAECQQLLTLAFERLVGVARAPDTPPSLRIASIQHLKYALAELAGHLAKQDAPEPPLSHYVERLQQARAAVSHAIKHIERTNDWARCGHCLMVLEPARRPAHPKRAASTFKRKEKP